MNKKLLIVDGHALAYRAFFAFPDSLTTPDGRPSGAVFGFGRILFAAIRDLNPTHVCICFDPPGDTFRNEQNAAYKAQRASMPENLVTQMPMLKEVAEALEIPHFEIPGYEADDLIGSIAVQAADDTEVVILTGDQDLIQLVSEKIHIQFPALGFAKAFYATPKSVVEKYGFTPLQMIEYKALRGDASDNIPGVPGIGEVTAKQLIGEFHDITNLYQQIDAGKVTTLKPNVMKKLVEGRASALESHDLATIRTSIDLETFSIDDCVLHTHHPENAVRLFTNYGFKSLIKELPGTLHVAAAAADVFAPAETIDESAADAADEALKPVLRAMEERGIMVDRDYLQELEKEFASEIEKYSTEIFALAGQSFNLDSPTQLSAILYETLNIPTAGIRKTERGFTTDADAMQKLAPLYPIAQSILNYREVAKLQSTYVLPLQQLPDEHDRIHTTYAADTTSGRLSSRNPNLQNIPVRTERGRKLRNAFIASKDHILIAADYSQIELRVAAHLSNDPVMVEAFKSGKDFHAETAARMGIDRRAAKIINFSILYGKGAFGFSNDLGITFEEARRYIAHYFETYSGLKKWIDELLENARVNGYVATPLGRRRYLPDLKSSNANRRNAAEREAVNMPIQGYAAEIMKLSMVKVEEALRNYDAKLILNVHDELVVEAPLSEEAAVSKLLKDVMENTVTLSVPVVAEVHSGKRWAELKG